MFSHIRITIFSICLLLAVDHITPCFAAEPAPKTEAELLGQLQDSKASFHDKSAACKRLAVVGTEAAVPVLATLLDTEHLSHYARYALEPIPSDQVDAALIASLGTLKGKHLVGVIQSIASRGKPEAIDALAGKLDDADREVAKMAAHSIARLGTPKAGKILGDRLSSEFADAALVCAKQLARQGHLDQAIALFTKLLHIEGVPEHIHLAAMLQTIRLQGHEGLELLGEALASDDEKTFNHGLRTARLIDKADAAKVARQVLKNSAPARAALLLTLLGDLNDLASLPAVIDAIGSDNDSVKVAALGAMASLGGAEHVSLLVDEAGDESEASAVALQTLVALPGGDVDRAVLELLNDEKRQDTVVTVIGKRRISSAVPKLVAMIDAPNRIQVVAALGETISLDQLDILGKRLDSKPEDFNAAIRKALHAACDRMPNRSATVAKLSGYMKNASDVTVQLVMDELRQIGGPEALAAVAAAAKSDVQAQREYATRALGNWLDISAARLC